ncbi:juvenile hormone acid O-methyltransferase-like, partial [Aphis craccivora]
LLIRKAYYSAFNLLKCSGQSITYIKNNVLDIGCGPGDVTSDILYPLLKNKINQLVGVDKSIEMIEYAKKTYECSNIKFQNINRI